MKPACTQGHGNGAIVVGVTSPRSDVGGFIKVRWQWRGRLQNVPRQNVSYLNFTLILTTWTTLLTISFQSPGPGVMKSIVLEYDQFPGRWRLFRSCVCAAFEAMGTMELAAVCSSAGCGRLFVVLGLFDPEGGHQCGVCIVPPQARSSVNLPAVRLSCCH